MIKPDAAYMAQSQERLKKIVSKKHETTIIGTLDRIEKVLGFLWGDTKHLVNAAEFDNNKRIDVYNTIKEIEDIISGLSPDEGRELMIRFKLLWQVLRESILNHGNDNKRDCEKEISMYDVSWRKYTIKMPVKRNI